MRMLLRFLKNEKGATAIEYGLIVALISVAALITSNLAGTQIVTSYSHVASTLASSTGR